LGPDRDRHGLWAREGRARADRTHGEPLLRGDHPPPPEITFGLAIGALILGLGATLFAAYFPARAAARVDPVEPLRRSTRTVDLQRIPYGKLLALGLLFVIPGVIGAQFVTNATSFGSMGCLLAASLFAVPALVIGLRRLILRPVELGFGIPGRLAMDNAQRSLGRSVLTVGALMTAVSSSVCIGLGVFRFRPRCSLGSSNRCRRNCT